MSKFPKIPIDLSEDEQESVIESFLVRENNLPSLELYHELRESGVDMFSALGQATFNTHLSNIIALGMNQSNQNTIPTEEE